MGDSNSRPDGPKGVRTWCYMCMNYIWRCLVRKTCSPALFSPLFPRPPKAVVVKHVVVEKHSRGGGRFAVPRERLDCSALLPDSQGRFGYFYAHFPRRSRQRNTESRNTAFVFSKFCFCCYRKNEFRQFLLWNKNLPKFC